MNLKEFTKQLAQSSKFQNLFGISKYLPYEISKMLIQARIAKGFTQEELANKLNTKQSSVARAENGKLLPSLSFLQKIAKIYDTYLIPPKFAFMDEIYKSINLNARQTEHKDEKFFVGDKPSIYSVHVSYPQENITHKFSSQL